MLHALELENFKAFGERTRIPFAPITLIFGENSAGKSTILQALYLLKQTHESRDTGAPLHPRAENGIVDLGSFQEMIFDHNLGQPLSVRIETTMDRRGMFRLPYKENTVAIEFSFEMRSLKKEIRLDQIGVYHGKSSKCIARFKPSDKTVEPREFRMMMGSFHDSFGLSPSKLVEAKCSWLTKATEYWKPEFEWCKENKKEILKELEERKLYLERSLKHQIDEEKVGNEQKRSKEALQETDKLQRDLDSVNVDFEFFSSDFDLKVYISKRHREAMNTLLGVQRFLPVGVIQGENESWVTGSISFFPFRLDATVFDVAEFVISSAHALEQTLRTLFPIRPFRSPAERYYSFTGTSPQDVGYRGDLLPDLLFRHPELVVETNNWLKQLDIGYELEVKPVEIDTGDLYQVRLIDMRRKKPVNVALPDVGFGISQLLPFVVQSLVSKGRIISIEQPEVHVHPKLQADLGDLLAEAIKESRRNQVIIETHSEHLILRLQRLVRKKQIKPEDVSVIYVNRGSEGAKAERLHLDEDGDFIDEWPNGFFLERLRELR